MPDAMREFSSCLFVPMRQYLRTAVKANKSALGVATLCKIQHCSDNHSPRGPNADTCRPFRGCRTYDECKHLNRAITSMRTTNMQVLPEIVKCMNQRSILNFLLIGKGRLPCKYVKAHRRDDERREPHQAKSPPKINS